MVPLWLAALATDAKSFAGNPIIGSPRLNQWGLHERRMRLAARMAQARRARLAAAMPAADVESFRRDGYVVKPDVLPEAVFRQLREEVFAAAWPVLEMREGPTLTRRVPLDPARLDDRNGALGRFLCHRGMLALLAYAASARGRPEFALQAVLTDPLRSAEDPQSVVHCDAFHPMGKAWFFLNDVGLDDGPVFYVPGSHRLTAERAAWSREQSLTARTDPDPNHAGGRLRISAADLRRLGLPDPRPLAVSANSLLVVDLFGFHGRTPRRSVTPTVPRVEINAVLRCNPFAPWSGVDVLSARRLARRFGLARTSFRSAGMARIDEPARDGAGATEVRRF